MKQGQDQKFYPWIPGVSYHPLLLSSCQQSNSSFFPSLEGRVRSYSFFQNPPQQGEEELGMGLYYAGMTRLRYAWGITSPRQAVGGGFSLAKGSLRLSPIFSVVKNIALIAATF